VSCNPLLGKEARVQDAAVGIVQRDHQVLPGQARAPFKGRGIKMDQHAHQGPALALASVLVARRFFLHHARFLHISRN
jgi:hypothetical protein